MRRVVEGRAHRPGMNGDARNLRLRVTRREEPDVEWVLNIAEARHRAHLTGEPDPYGLPPPGLAEQSDGRDDGTS